MSEEKNNNAESLIGELYGLLDAAWSLPLSHGRSVVDRDEVRQILDELRDTLPQEIRKAKAIVADRSKILTDAKKEADSIIRVATERARALTSDNNITRNAQKRANELVVSAQKQAREMRRASSEYVDDLMRRAEEGLAGQLTELRQTHQSIKQVAQHGVDPSKKQG